MKGFSIIQMGWDHLTLDLASVRTYWTWTWTLLLIEAEMEMAGWDGAGEVKEMAHHYRTNGRHLDLETFFHSAFFHWWCCPACLHNVLQHTGLISVFFLSLRSSYWFEVGQVSEKTRAISIMEYFNQNVMRVVCLSATHSPDEADQLFKYLTINGEGFFLYVVVAYLVINI